VQPIFLQIKDFAMRTTTRLRELLDSPDLLVAPGAYDALSARLIAQAGFRAVYMTGFGTAATYAMLDLLEILKRGETPAPFREQMVTFAQFTNLIGLRLRFRSWNAAMV